MKTCFRPFALSPSGVAVNRGLCLARARASDGPVWRRALCCGPGGLPAPVAPGRRWCRVSDAGAGKAVPRQGGPPGRCLGPWRGGEGVGRWLGMMSKNGRLRRSLPKVCSLFCCALAGAWAFAGWRPGWLGQAGRLLGGGVGPMASWARLGGKARGARAAGWLLRPALCGPPLPAGLCALAAATRLQASGSVPRASHVAPLAGPGPGRGAGVYRGRPIRSCPWVSTMRARVNSPTLSCLLIFSGGSRRTTPSISGASA